MKLNTYTNNNMKLVKRTVVISALLYTYRKDVGCLAIGSSHRALCWIHNDPHIRPFHSNEFVGGDIGFAKRWWFDYRSSCNLVAVKSSYVNVHIRTEDYGAWAGTRNVAIGFNNGYTYEFHVDDSGNMKVYANGQDVSGEDLNSHCFEIFEVSEPFSKDVCFLQVPAGGGPIAINPTDPAPLPRPKKEEPQTDPAECLMFVHLHAVLIYSHWKH